MSATLYTDATPADDTQPTVIGWCGSAIRAQPLGQTVALEIADRFGAVDIYLTIPQLDQLLLALRVARGVAVGVRP